MLKESKGKKKKKCSLGCSACMSDNLGGIRGSYSQTDDGVSDYQHLFSMICGYS